MGVKFLFHTHEFFTKDTMRKTAVVTDSSAALPPDEIARMSQQGGFRVVPLTVKIRANSHISTADQLLQESSSGHNEKIQTASPGPGAFAEIYQELLDEGYERILSLHLSSELSSACQSARAGARMVSAEVVIVDSRTVAMALGGSVIKIYSLAQHTDISLQELAVIAHEICENTGLFFCLPTLEALRSGGRVHPALARVGQLLQIRPIGTIIDGSLTYLERPRSLEKAKEALQRIIFSEKYRRAHDHPHMECLRTPQPTGEILAIHFSGEPQLVNEWLEVEEEFVAQWVVPFPPVLTAHTGPDAIAVVIY